MKSTAWYVISSCIFLIVLTAGSAAVVQAGGFPVAVEKGRVDVDPNMASSISDTLTVQMEQEGVPAMGEGDVKMLQKHERREGAAGSKAAQAHQSAPVKLRWNLLTKAKKKPAIFSIEAIDVRTGKRIFIERTVLKGRDPFQSVMIEAIPSLAKKVARRLKDHKPVDGGTQGPTSPLPKLPKLVVDTKIDCGKPQLAPLEKLARYYLEAINVLESNRNASCTDKLKAVTKYRADNKEAIAQLRKQLISAAEPIKPFLACKNHIKNRGQETMLDIMMRCKAQRKEITITVSAILELPVVDTIKR